MELVTLRFVESQKMKLRTSSGPPEEHDGREYEGRGLRVNEQGPRDKSLQLWKFGRGNDSTRAAGLRNFRLEEGLA